MQSRKMMADEMRRFPIVFASGSLRLHNFVASDISRARSASSVRLNIRSAGGASANPSTLQHGELMQFPQVIIHKGLSSAGHRERTGMGLRRKHT